MVRRSVPASSRCTANAWRSECGVTGLESFDTRLCLGQVASTALVDIGSPATAPGNIHAPGGSHGAPIVRQHLQQPGRQHDVAVFLSLALLDAQHHALAIDSLRLQAGRLGNTQAGGIACRQDRLVFEALDAAKEVPHLLRAENDGQCLWRL